MNPLDLRALLQARPFVPFRLYMTVGRTFNVHHPEFVLIGSRGGAVVFEADDPSSSNYDRYANIVLLHVTRTEPLETAPPR